MTPEELADIVTEHRDWLAGTSGKRADLSRADLSNADLSDAGLRGADLRGADLRFAVLRCADLRVAVLRGADLRGADLINAALRSADLSNADLSDTKLWGCVGNMREIKSAQISRYPLTWTRSADGIDTLQIGCKRHTLDQWEAFDDDAIAAMDSKALEWWKANRDLVLMMVKTSPAVPHRGEA